jgi:hypothetical protein
MPFKAEVEMLRLESQDLLSALYTRDLARHLINLLSLSSRLSTDNITQ